MSKGANTRETIIGEALSQAVELGLEGVTLGVLASRLNLSKSGLFAHFKSKEALQLAVLEAATDRFRARVATPAFARPKGRGRVAALFEHWLAWLDGDAGEDGQRALPGCPFVTAAQEYDQRPGAVRDLLVRSQVEWHGALRWATAQAVTQGDFRADLDPDLFVFELIGIALGYQQMRQLMQDPAAQGRAHAAFDRLLADAAARPVAASAAAESAPAKTAPANTAPAESAPAEPAPAEPAPAASPSAPAPQAEPTHG